MTREERENAIKVIKNYDLNFFDVNKVLFSPEEIANAFDCALEALEQEPKADWIPVSERLPDTIDKVLCWYEYYHWSQKKVLPEYGLGRYLRETSTWFGEVANGKDVRVIAWMPLPKPYKVESEGE